MMNWLKCLLVCACMPGVCFCMTPEELEQKLRMGCYHVLTVTRDYMQNDMYQLGPKDLSDVLEKASEAIKEIQDPVFVVMNEYMCSRKTLEYGKFESLQNLVLEHSKGYPRAFYCVNFLYQLKDGVSEEEWGKLSEYLKPVDDLLIDEYDRNTRYSWPIVNPNGSIKAFFEDRRRMFANETFVINRGSVVSRYRKSTYYNEDPGMLEKGWSYHYGFGRNEPTDHTFSSIIDRCVYLDVCFDIQKQIRLWLYRIAHSDESDIRVFFASYDGAEEALQRLRGLLPKSSYERSPDSFSLHIIQSNSTAICDAIGYFPDGQVVIQSDPNVSAVFRLSRSEHAKHSKALHPVPIGWIEKLNVVSMCYPFKPARWWFHEVEDDDFGSRSFMYMLYNVRERIVT